MKLLAFVLSLVPAIASAHIDNGLWRGVDASGLPCEMKVLENFFENNTHHPLNERIKVEVNGQEYILRHPPVISEADKKAFFDHDSFEAIVATSQGGKALVVKMSHSPSSKGPVSFSEISHEYRADLRNLTSCSSLQFVK